MTSKKKTSNIEQHLLLSILRDMSDKRMGWSTGVLEIFIKIRRDERRTKIKRIFNE
jgi:hypothetical protein